MRSRQTIEREIYQAREDLEARLNELRQVVHDKTDVKARAQVLLEEKKQQARAVARRSAEGAKVLARRSVDGVKYGAVRTKDGVVFVYGRAARITRERPLLVGGIVAGVILAGVTALLLIRRARRPWYARY
jgi:hypothetical protein